MSSPKLPTLPYDIICVILAYANIKDRNGKYMNQIPENDPRYAILSTIPKAIDVDFSRRDNHCTFHACIEFSNKGTYRTELIIYGGCGNQSRTKSITYLFKSYINNGDEEEEQRFYHRMPWHINTVGWISGHEQYSDNYFREVSMMHDS